MNLLDFLAVMECPREQIETEVALLTFALADRKYRRMLNRSIGAMPMGPDRDEIERKFIAALIVLRTVKH